MKRPPTSRLPVSLALLLAAPLLAGCLGSSQPQPPMEAEAPTAYALDAAAADFTPAEGTEPPMGPFVVEVPEGADTVLFDMPMPEAALREDEFGRNEADLVFDVAATDASGNRVPPGALFLGLYLWSESGGQAYPSVLAVWVPQAEVQGDGESGALLPRSHSGTAYVEEAGAPTFAVTVTGPGVVSARVAVAWQPEDVPAELAEDKARERIAALGEGLGIAAKATGSGGHLALALELEGTSLSYGLELTQTTLASVAGVDVERRMATAYESPASTSGYRLEAAVALLHRGVVDWAWQYDGAVQGDAGAVAVDTGYFPADYALYGIAGFVGIGMVPEGTAPKAAYREHVVAGQRFIFLQLHLHVPVPAEAVGAADYALLDCSGVGWELQAGCLVLASVVPRAAGLLGRSEDPARPA